MDLSTGIGVGGNIDLTASTAATVIDTSNSGNAGNVTLVAFSNGGATGGNILLPSSSAINASSSNGNGGNVSIIAGAANGNAIQVGSINTSPKPFVGNGGNILVTNALPAGDTGTSIVYNTDGTVSSGPNQAQNIVTSGSLQTGNISVGNLIAGTTAATSFNNEVTASVSTAGNGNITFTGTANPLAVIINLQAGGTISLSQTAGANVTALPGVSFSQGGNIFIEASQIVLDANSNTLFDASSAHGIGGQITLFLSGGGLNIGTGNNQAAFTTASTALGGQIAISATGGAVNVDPSAITAFTVGNGPTVSISITGTSINQVGTSALQAGTVSLSATAGDIGATLNPVLTITQNLTADAGGNVFIQNTGSLTLTSGSGAGPTSSFNLTNKVDGGGNGQIVFANGATITAGTVNLQSNGTALDGSQGGITVFNNQTQNTVIFAPTINLSDGNGSGGTGAGAIQVVTDQGAAPVSFNVSTTGAVQIFTGNLTTNVGDTILGGSVEVFGQTGQNLTVNNQGTIKSTNTLIEISATPDSNDVGGNIYVKGGGTMTSAAQLFIEAEVSADGLSSNVLEFTGNQTFATFVAPITAGNNQAIIVDSGVTLTASVLPFGANVQTQTFINNGTLVGGWIFTLPNRCRHLRQHQLNRYQRSGRQALLPGEQLTILSGGNITDSGSNTISLVNATGNGGNLYLLAGFAFTPVASLGISPDTTTAFNITANSSGNIYLPNTTINTAGGSVNNGGNVFAYANGSVNIGTITTGTGLATSNGGAVTIIGNGVSVGTINTSGANGGNVSISSAGIALNFNQSSGTITVQNGIVYGGGFLPGPASGNISITGLSGINASALGGSATVTLNALAGGVTAPGGILIGSNGALVATVGFEGFGTKAAAINTDASFITANAGTVGSIYIVDVINGPSTFTILGQNTGNNYSVQGSSFHKVFNSLDVDSLATITATTVNLGNVDSINIGTANGITTNSLTMTANGTLTLAGTTIAVNSDINGNGGTVIISAKDISAPGAIVINANGTSSGNGGVISVTTTDTTASMTVGTTGAGLIVQAMATSGPVGGNGGTVSFSSANILLIETDTNGNPFGPTLGINALPQFTDGTGQKISLQGQTIAWTFDNDKTTNLTPLLLNVNGVGSGDGGTISVTVPAAAITIENAINAIAPSATSGPNGGNGGSISFSAGSMQVDPAALTVAPQLGSGKGGTISLTATAAAGITSFSGQLNLNVDGIGTGSGGTINVAMPSSTTAAIIGTTGTNLFQFSANAGPTGGPGGTLGNGGKVTFINGGGITVNPAQITVNSAGSDGTGGTIDIEAGQAGSGNLLVSSSLSAPGAGSGNGGSITLISNSTTAMLIGATKTVNGTIALSVPGGTGSPAGAPGSITIKNEGGALTVTQPLTAVSAVDLETGKNGTLTVSNNLGSAATNTITLSTVLGGATGGKISAKVLQAGAVNVSAGTQALTLSLSTSDLSVTAMGNVTATTTATAPALLTIDGIAGPASSAAGVISVSTAGNLVLSTAPVSGTAVTLKSSGKAGTILVGSSGSIVASTGAIVVTAAGGVQIDGTITDTATKGAVTITAAGTGATIADNGGGTITAGGAVALTAAKGAISQSSSDTIQSKGSTVTLSAANLVTQSGTLNGLAGVTIKSTALKAADGIDAATLTSANGPITLTAVGNIQVSGVVQAGTTVKETAGTNGTITNDMAIKALGPKGAITLAAPGATGAITTEEIVDATTTVTRTAPNGITTNGQVTAGTNATLTASAATGAIQINGGLTATNGAVVLTGADGVQTNSAVTAGTTVKITSSATSSNVTINNPITATGPKGAVTLTTSGTGGVISIDGAVTTTGAAVLSAAKGGIVLNVSVTSNKSSVALTAGNSISEPGSITAGTSATLKTTIASSLVANDLAVHNITTDNGAITVIGAGSKVFTQIGSTISANSAALKPAKATVLIEASNTKVVGAGPQVEIDTGTNINTGGPLGGTVSISIGAPAAVFGKAPTAGLATFQENGTAFTPVAGGPFFFGTNGITVSGGANTIFNSVFTAPAKPPQVILNSGKAPATALQIDAGTAGAQTKITADPIPMIAAPPLVATQSLSLTNLGAALNNQVAPSAPGFTSAALNSSSALNVALTSNSSTSASLLPTVNAGVSGSNSATFIAGRPALAGYDPQIAGASTPARTNWISDTEITSGAIPAILYGGNTLGINAEVSSVIEMEESQANELLSATRASSVKYQSARKNAALTGAVSENVGNGKTVTLHRGSVVFAPTERTLVRTPFGDISIDAKSLVLIISYARGVAVYDLDDRHAGAVTVQSGGRSIGLTPGRSVVVTSDGCDRFEEINPAQRVAYRKIRACNLADGRKAFAGEFSAMSAAAAVIPLRQLLAADHHEAKRIANSLLKTTAIVAQTQGSTEQYRHYLRPSLTASAR